MSNGDISEINLIYNTNEFENIIQIIYFLLFDKMFLLILGLFL